MATVNKVDPHLQHEFSPSEWSPRAAALGGPSQLVQAHIDHAKAMSLANRNSLAHECIIYGNTAEERLLWFSTPSDSAKSAVAEPLLVFIHGGYWQSLLVLESCYMARASHETGVHFAALGYELAPSATVESIVQQVRTGLEIILKRAASDDHVQVS